MSSPLDDLIQSLIVSQNKAAAEVKSSVVLATVNPAYTSGNPQVIFDGETAVSAKGYPCLKSYQPYANDRVLMMRVGNSFVIAGAVSSTRPFYQPWTDFTPTWGGTAGASNVTIARYMRMGNTVWGHVELTIGTGGSLDGSLFLTVPETIKTSEYHTGFAGSSSVGTCRMRDNSTANRYTGTVGIHTSTQLRFWTDSAAGGSVAIAALDPFTWAVSDTMSAEFTYECA